MINNFIEYIPNKHDDCVIFDVGSRDCGQSIEFYNKFPNAKIYAFECNPNTLNICKKNIEQYSDRITLIEGAVCDYDGEIKFYPINQQKTITSWKDGNPGASSLFKSNGKYQVEQYVQDEIVTNCHRLDSVMQKYGIPKVDILWMDLQGAELLTLKGLGVHLQNVKYIHTEISYREMYSGQVMFEELNNFIISNEFIIKNKLSFIGWQEDIIYEKIRRYSPDSASNQFDIVIPVGPNDAAVIDKQIVFTKKNVIGYRNIYLVVCDPKINIDGCITINENIFPVSLETVSTIHGKMERNGWYLQQLLKLYAGKTIPGILERYLVVDSDTFFFKPTVFVENDKCLYNFGVEFHTPYFNHMAKMDANLVKMMNKSGICHHMMFETKYVNEMMSAIEAKHDDQFYNVFLKCVSEADRPFSGASEYEIYYNYMLKNHRDHIAIRELKYKNVKVLAMDSDMDYVSYHWYMR